MSSIYSPYPPRVERGNCGIGFVAQQHGRASHAILRLGLQALVNLQHRGAFAADARTGDGAGVLTPLPRPLFAREAERLTGQPVDPEQLAVGVFFFEPTNIETSLSCAEAAFARHHLKLLAWRNVPVNSAALGERARATQPRILQALITHNPLPRLNPHFETQLFLARKDFERSARQLGAYVPSLSSRTIVYKGLCLAQQLPEFYADLRDPEYAVALTVFHQRYSTNTLPTWARAQPFRVLCHNGEINTLQGNLAWMQAREPKLDFAGVHDARRLSLLRPVIDTQGSDSAMLDNVAELLVRGGRDIQHALTMLVPPAWERLPDVPQALRDFYAYHAGLTEPWDGPAALVFTDGATVGATLDRNGLRPCRYLITEEGLVAAASEAGAVPVEPESILVLGRLGPGQMLMVDTARGQIQEDPTLKAELAARQPYGNWVRAHTRKLSPDTRPSTPDLSPTPMGMGGFTTLLQQQAAFGYTSEELAVVIKPMVEDQVEALGSMGDDTPLAVLSDKPRPLFSYFRQRFAEVTNPPIDPLRESLVMSLTARLGARGNFLAETPEQARLLELASPFLTSPQLAALKADPALKAVTLSTLFRVAEGRVGLAPALRRLCAEAEAAVRAGAQVLVLSDRGVSARHSFIPALLAVSAVHHHLLRADMRTMTDLVVESGEPREVHHFATLIGYGAAAVNPYLALTSAAELARRSHTPAEAEARYLRAVEHGLLKIMSKMGISTADAYCGAQIFETLGVHSTVVEEHFAGTPAHLEGLDLTGIADIVLRWHEAAFTPAGQPTLDSPGLYKFKRSGELHAYSPAIVHALHAAVKTPGALNGHWDEGYAAYKHYSALQHNRAPLDVRDLLEISNLAQASPISSYQVEPAASILHRFSTAAMSHGALSAEAHETMTIAMNRLGALSNSGEGGEDARRYKTEGNDRIKQVASARFGVTPAYLVHADELQIKMAQGSKPGEGGQLPGHKVTAEIAVIRHATPGLTLISPPPHHDIYSIEDLAQLIYDLRQINPRAVISVKLVAQAGVGTIAAGVAKAGADVILISGNSGGTGASPLSSIKYAGLPWEIGLAEAHYVLMESGLRGQVRLRADGGLRTGRDVVLAALLGADEYSFGTAAVVAEGCLMARACHLNTCPVGIATQKPELRAKFEATPEQVMAFFLYVAEEVREALAGLGVSSLNDLIGRVELLKQKPGLSDKPGLSGLDVSRLLLIPPGDGPRRYVGAPNPVLAASPLNEQFVADVERESLLDHPLRLLRGQQFLYHITNRDRTFAARLAGKIVERHGEAGLPDGALRVKLYGSAGQSFGAFGVPGLTLTLIGEANDYVGKGLAGGRLVIQASVTHLQSPVLAGNTCLYGATGGELFIAGRVGERFAVRNSGAVAIVEGVGDHGCEYMTGGLVIVLGVIGRNFAAGMTGGVAYVLDLNLASQRINPELVNVTAPDMNELEGLHAWITQHLQHTRSQVAANLLEEWMFARFLKVAPKDQPNTSDVRSQVVHLPTSETNKADIVVMSA